MTRQADLIAYIFEGPSHPLLAELRQWMDSSARFTAFVDTYRDKIRKKVRITREPDSALDLLAELEVAYCLLNDRRFDVVYEPYASAKTRGPDFAVTYRANLVFNVEVTHLHAEESEIDLARKEERILRILLGKLGQMQPGMSNLLVIHTRTEVAQKVDLSGLMQAMKVRVDRKDPAFFAASGYSDPAGFYKDFLRVGGILLWASSPQLWVNKQARHGLDARAMRLVVSLAGGGGDRL